MSLEQKMQLIALAASATGPDVDHAAIVRQLSGMATPDALEMIACGNVDAQARIVLFAAAALARQ